MGFGGTRGLEGYDMGRIKNTVCDLATGDTTQQQAAGAAERQRDTLTIYIVIAKKYLEMYLNLFMYVRCSIFVSDINKEFMDKNMCVYCVLHIL